MTCSGCGFDKAARLRGMIDPETKKYVEVCDVCGNLGAIWLPDVYLGGVGGQERTDENLCDSKGKPIPFSTKREKAAIMNMLNLRQADSAEHQHGARNEAKRKTYFT